MRTMSSNIIAPDGMVFVCHACGKRSKDLYGEQKIDRGWDESCMMNSVLCDEKSIVMKNGVVIKADAAKHPFNERKTNGNKTQI